MELLKQNTAERPSPADYRDYRSYLKDMVNYLRATQRGFSYRNFARKAGFATSNFLKLVEQGKRNLSADSVAKFSKGLSLTEWERGIFEALVSLGQAKNDDERNRHYRKLSRALSTDKTVSLERDQYEYYSLWYAAAVREMLLLPDFEEDPAWIAKRLQPAIKPTEAARALELLQRIGLVVRNAAGRLTPADVKIASPQTIHTLGIRNFHRAMLQNAERTLDGVAVEKRNITSLTVALSPEQYAEVCAKVAEFRSELQSLIDEGAGSGEAKEVYVLGFPIFPVTG